MKLKFLAVGAIAFVPVCASAVLPNVGFYQTIDDETSKPKSIIALYEYMNGDDVDLAGRIVALYDDKGVISETLSAPVRVADKVSGTPKMVGLDVVWNMEWDAEDARYEDGKIMDPKKGSIYSSVIWAEPTNATKLNVRGKIGPFGRTQVWNLLNEKDLPADLKKLDMKNWTPTIRK